MPDGLEVSKDRATRSAIVPTAAIDAVRAKLASLEVTIATASALPMPLEDVREADFVLGLGASGTAAGLAYASAMGRPFRAFGSFDALAAWAGERRPSTAFVFLPEATFDIRAIPELVERSLEEGFAVGFLPVPADVPAAVAEAMRLVALSLVEAPNTWGPIVYSGAPPGEGHAVFGDDEVEAFRARAREGAAAIVLEGHGNGCDFRLGPNALCVQVDDLRPSLAKKGEKALPCHFGGPCLRRECGFVGVAELRTSVLVMLTCTGWLASGGLLDPRFGLAAAALRGPTVRAIVTTIELSQAPWTFATATEDFLTQGGSVGDLAYSLNQELAKGTRGFLCIGDPTTTIPTRSASDASPRPAREAKTPAAADAADGAGPTSFRALAVRELVALGFFDEAARAAAQDARGFADLLGTYATRRSGYLAEIFASRSHPAHGVTFEAVVPTGLRHACGAALLRADSTPHPRYAAGRSNWVCRRCGCIADVPAAMALPTVAIDTRMRARIEGLPRDRELFVVAVVESTGDVLGVRSDVMRAHSEDGTLAVAVPTSNVEAGLQVMAIVVAWKDDFAVLRAPYVV